MKIAILSIHRGDRPEFLENLKQMIARQTIQPDIIHFVDYRPESNNCDISQRYRIGYDFLRKKQIDVILLMEVDDYYSPDYIETMITKWNDCGRPDLLGTSYTIYYHIKLFAHFTFYHTMRSSAMSTLIRPDLNFKWCVDAEPYTDVWLWNKLKGVIFTPEKHICLGIKHGTTMTGGVSHVDRLDRYISLDHNKDFLRQNMDAESFNFYSNFIK